MMHESKVTEPPWTKTPPPCNNKQNVGLPSGRWEVFKVLCGTYILKLTEALAAVVQA